MTKDEFKYITGYEDEEQLANIMLLEGNDEPEDGDWTELMKQWYDSLLRTADEYMSLYHIAIKATE